LVSLGGILLEKNGMEFVMWCSGVIVFGGEIGSKLAEFKKKGHSGGTFGIRTVSGNN
jgi:hypothetical protein